MYWGFRQPEPHWEALSPRIWKMMSSGSGVTVPSFTAELVSPLVHADVRFWLIDAKADASPNFASR
jgi:hypothetical protein